MMKKQNHNSPDRKSHVVNCLMIGFVAGFVLGMLVGFSAASAIGMCLGVLVGVQLDVREKRILDDDMNRDPSSINIHLA